MSRTAVLFPGQGAQVVGMAADFVANHTVARDLFALADDVLGIPLSRYCLEGPEEELTRTCHCQPAIYLTGAAIMAVLEAEGIVVKSTVAGTAGLSLGEYTALYYAGVFSFEDGLRLVAERGSAMQDASDAAPSGMISLVGASREVAADVAQKAAQDNVLVVANLLSEGQVVLSGAVDAIERVPAVAKECGIRRAIPLKVAGAFHSPLMAPAAERLRAALDETEMQAPSFPVFGNVTGRAMTDVNEIRSSLEAQVVEPVLWVDAMQAMISTGFERIIEPGPGRVLAGILRKIDRSCVVEGYNSLSDLEEK